MSATCARCARCGLPCWEIGRSDIPSPTCSAHYGGTALVLCRDRELANLHSLLRSVTGKLEEAADDLASRNDDRLLRPLATINSVLEVLS